ncbi:Channel-forming transporter/cytolysins activator of TpsB family [Pseudomonas sp. R1-43-08]|nr:Channel-forming transporter/cytolysins activator of TpsB family [Pseudomonas sp. R1-43-08]
MWRSIRLGGLSVIVCLSTTGWVQAATAQNTPGITDLIRDRQDRLLEEQQRRIDELKDLPGKSAATAAPATPSTPAASRSEPSSWAVPKR